MNHRRRRFICAVSLAGMSTLSACRPGSGGAEAGELPGAATLADAPAGPAISASIGTAATTLALKGVAEVEVPGAAFATRTRVGIRATASAMTAADFYLSAQMFGAPVRAAQEIRIDTGKVRPSKVLAVTASVPADLAARMADQDWLLVFVQVWQDGGAEVLDSFEPVAASYDGSRKRLRFVLAPAMFTDRRTSGATWEAVIVLGAMRAAQAGTNARSRPSAVRPGGGPGS